MKTQIRLVIPFAMVSLFGIAACDTEGACTTEARSSVSVAIVDAAGAAVSDATVTFSVDGGAAQDCANNPFEGSYVCGYEQSGSFTITATKGADTKKQTVTVKDDADGCHVESQSITMTLGA